MRELVVILLKLVQIYGERFCTCEVERSAFNTHIKELSTYFERDSEVGDLFD